MSEPNNESQMPSHRTTQSPGSKQQPPQTPDIEFIKTYPRRYDSSHHHPQEQDFQNETVMIETNNGSKPIEVYLLRVYPDTFNGFDAYMDISTSYTSDAKSGINKVKSSRLNKVWKVIAGPSESPISGYFRGDYSNNNPPVWMFGLRLLKKE